MTRPRETIFGVRLAEARAARGLEIEALAFHCHVSQSSIEQWIGDRCEPLLAYAYKVASALGYDVEDLADPALEGALVRRREDRQLPWTFGFKGSVCTTAFGPTLKAELAAREIQIKQFAMDIGVPRCAVTKWVSERLDYRAEPRLTSAMRAADELGLSLHGLCSGEIRARGPR